MRSRPSSTLSTALPRHPVRTYPRALQGHVTLRPMVMVRRMMVRVVGGPLVVMTAVRVRLVGDMMRGVLDD